ncbi:hypothetical protein BVC71_13940 [Marivivens niveibacter]|uniref:Sugar transporter n=1 Tax=Marivivens niveibacter TaxID=1930667 RepID=A0A251WW63_9RHOB|nr:hypothetical protein [Marivivens niveibacter]OUD08368.1 hypothetical protein BVC71_13940 [Marivivens niveibacter]
MTDSQRIASPAYIRPRHRGLALLFVLMVALPVLATAGYMFAVAKDQYASTLGFTVRVEDQSVTTDLLGGLGRSLGASTSTESDVLDAFIRSQDIVSRIDAYLDLAAMYSRYRSNDPLLAYDPDGTIEDLTRYWQRMSMVGYDTNSGLIEITARAFDRHDAQSIAQAIYDHSTQMVNALSEQARADATRYALADLERAEDRLRDIREDMTEFRIRNQIVDPEADVQGQMGLLTTLQAQLAETLIEYDLLLGNVTSTDPRLDQLNRRIDVIGKRIDEERAKFGIGDSSDAAYVATIAEYERLAADREFAELAYTAARQAYDIAVAEAQRQSLYLAAYIQPTLAEKSTYPKKWTTVGGVLFFCLMGWAVFTLVYYSLRDRP